MLQPTNQCSFGCNTGPRCHYMGVYEEISHGRGTGTFWCFEHSIFTLKPPDMRKVYNVPDLSDYVEDLGPVGTVKNDQDRIYAAAHRLRDRFALETGIPLRAGLVEAYSGKKNGNGIVFLEAQPYPEAKDIKIRVRPAIDTMEVSDEMAAKLDAFEASQAGEKPQT